MKRYSSIIISLAGAAMLSLVATAAFATTYDQVTEALTDQTSIINPSAHVGPVEYWRFEEANGISQAKTETGYGTAKLGYSLPPSYLGNKTFTPAGIDGNGALIRSATGYNPRLSGSSSYSGDVGDMTSFKPHSFTIEYWVNPVDASAGRVDGNGIDSFAGTGTLSYWQAAGLNYGWFGFSTGAGAVAPGGGAGTYLITYAGTVPNNQWSMMAATFTETSATSGDWRFFINGQPQTLSTNSVSVGTVYHQTGLQNYADRGVWGGIGNFFETQSTAVDELAIFDFALSQNQILEQFNSVPEPGMLSLLALGGAFLVWRRKVAAKRA